MDTENNFEEDENYAPIPVSEEGVPSPSSLASATATRKTEEFNTDEKEQLTLLYKPRNASMGKSCKVIFFIKNASNVFI